MKKSIIPVALLIGMAGAAQAQMSLYGLIDMSYGKSLLGDVFLGPLDGNGIRTGEKADFHSGGDNGSSEGNSTTRIGIKGSTDVGSGIKANFKFETGGIGSDGDVNGGGNFFNRQAWAGFSGSFGEVRLGRQDSVSFQTMIDFDFNGASNGVSALGYSLTGPWLPGRQSRSLQYISPTVGGFSGQIGIVPKGNRGDDAKAVLSAGAKYAIGDLTVAGSLQTKDSTTTQNFTSVAASYDFGVAKVMAGYADGGKFAENGSGSGISLGVVAPIAGFNIGALLGKNDDDNVKITSYELFVNKEIFKGTYAYAEVGSWKTSLAVNPLDSEGKTKGTGFAVGVIWTF